MNKLYFAVIGVVAILFIGVKYTHLCPKNIVPVKQSLLFYFFTFLTFQIFFVLALTNVQFLLWSSIVIAAVGLIGTLSMGNRTSKQIKEYYCKIKDKEKECFWDNIASESQHYLNEMKFLYVILIGIWIYFYIFTD